MTVVQRSGFLVWSGTAVAVSGALTLLLNACLTPFLDPQAPLHETASSSVFLWRQGLSALAAALLAFGSAGLHLRQAERAGLLGTIAFPIAFLGSALLLAHEWNQIFLVRELALQAPETLRAIEDAKDPGPYDLGALITIGLFALGWIAFAASMLRARVFRRRGPILVIAGFFATPILGGGLPAPWGVIVGSAVLASGWISIGWELRVGEGREGGERRGH